MWLTYAFATFVLWGIWGAFLGKPTEHGFPETLSYVVWAIMTIPPAVGILAADRFRIATHRKAILYGALVGLTGCGGQVALFKVIAIGGPPYLVFPILALAPLITVILSFLLLGERTGKLGAVGVTLALVSIVVLTIAQQQQGGEAAQGPLWLIASLGILLAWGVQAYFMKVANNHMNSASVCFYNTVTAVLLIPLTLWMTDFDQPINWGFHGPYLAAIVQSLNAIGFVTYVLAFKYGKALIVAPLGNASPLLTVIITLAIEQRLPRQIEGAGIVLCLLAATFMVVDEQRHQPEPQEQSPSSPPAD
ncbi:MAG: DMT family transporter [Phycisphaerae bacterium]|nr:DMT family transporter [Phycisphaerae bacterium]